MRFSVINFIWLFNVVQLCVLKIIKLNYKQNPKGKNLNGRIGKYTTSRESSKKKPQNKII